MVQQTTKEADGGGVLRQEPDRPGRPEPDIPGSLVIGAVAIPSYLGVGAWQGDHIARWLG